MIDFEAIKAKVSLPEVASHYTALKKISGEYKGPCPLCGGEDRFYIPKKNPNVCACRKCDLKGDVIELVSRVEKISSIEAAHRLGGHTRGETPARARCSANENNPIEILESPTHARGSTIAREMLGFVRSSPTHARRSLAVPEEAKIVLPDQSWLDKARQQATTATELLKLTDPALKYLCDRGIAVNTAKSFGLGIGRYRGRLFITIPWQDQSGTITALKVRYIDDLAARDKSKRFTQKKGSVPLVFGLHLIKARKILIVVEGEFNAMTLWQELGDMADVVSIGSQSNKKGVEILKSLCQQCKYESAVAWFDEPGIARDVAGALKGFYIHDLTHDPKRKVRTIPMQSPGGCDANQLAAQEPGIVRRLILEHLRK